MTAILKLSAKSFVFILFNVFSLTPAVIITVFVNLNRCICRWKFYFVLILRLYFAILICIMSKTFLRTFFHFMVYANLQYDKLMKKHCYATLIAIVMIYLKHILFIQVKVSINYIQMSNLLKKQKTKPT